MAAAEAVVEVATGESPVEVGCVEVEGSVVVHQVDGLSGVADA